MKKLWHKLVAKVTGKNSISAPKELIIDQMNEPRALPMGRKEFDEWSDRIISGALIPGGEEDPIAFKESLKFAMAEMIMHLGKTESHKPDAYFIHTLRKGAINQVAHSVMCEIKKVHEDKKKAMEAEEAAKKAADKVAKE